jgi:hypothetical protein
MVTRTSSPDGQDFGKILAEYADALNNTVTVALAAGAANTMVPAFDTSVSPVSTTYLFASPAKVMTSPATNVPDPALASVMVSPRTVERTWTSHRTDFSRRLSLASRTALTRSRFHRACRTAGSPNWSVAATFSSARAARTRWSRVLAGRKAAETKRSTRPERMQNAKDKAYRIGYSEGYEKGYEAAMFDVRFDRTRGAA